MIDPNRRNERVCAICNEPDYIYKCSKCKFYFCEKDVCAEFIENHKLRGNIGGRYDIYNCCSNCCHQTECNLIT